MGAGWFGWAMPRRAYLRRQHATAKGNDPAVFGPVTKGHALECASARLRAERKVFMKAVKDYVEAELKDTSAELRADRRAVLAAVRHATMSSSPLRYASDELRADRKVVMAAVKRRGHALEYASAGLRADRKVVMAAVQSRASSLKFASNGLRADRKVVMTGVKGDGGARKYASAALQWDPEVYVEYLKCCGFRKRDHPELVVRCAELFRSFSAYSSLARDRDALGAAVGVRTLPAPHAALNGAPEALPIVHCLIARRQEVIEHEGHYWILLRSYDSFVRAILR